VEPLCYYDDKPLPSRDEILERLAGRAGPGAQLEVLRLLCPCRNTFRDADVWRAVKHLWWEHHVRDVREAAHHALISLRERARIDTRAASLLREINAGAEQRRHGWLWTGGRIRYPKPVRNDVPTIIEMLASDDAVEQEDALRALFRADGHRVAGAVWREIDRAARSVEPRLRAKAGLALLRIAQRRPRAKASSALAKALPQPR